MGYPPEIIEGEALGAASGYLGPVPADFGVVGTQGTSIGLDDALLGRHVLFLGGIGTGKTVGMTSLVRSIRAAARPDDVLVFFDTKGDYLEAFYTEGDVTVTGKPDGVHPGQTDWNVFAELRHTPPARLADDVHEIATTLLDDVGNAAGANNRIWSDMARDLLAALLIALARSGKPYSNADIRAISDKWTVAQMREVIEPYGDLRGTLQYIARDDSNTTVSVLIFLQQALRRSFSAGFSRLGTFSVRSFLREKGAKALFLEYDLASGASLGPVYRTLLDLALKESLGRERAAGRVILVLDEFALLPRLTHLDAGLNFGRSLGMRFIVGTQNVGQVREAYGAGTGSSILSGFGNVFAFRMFDEESRTYVRTRYGANRKLVRYDASLRTRGVGEQMVDGHTIEDWDLSSLQVGESIAGLAAHAPVRFTFAPPA
jgi:hypothetical protein